ncbi:MULTISPECIES: DNA-3-methyladenine glycosylase family protein [Bordetella]|uniref:DNA-3-methyladenine glycosylase II n=2 Tax=Bordetella TaxID=517 RepID=A0A261VSW0_9BORD|nr:MULTISPECIES: DNA-3-methyladenine glycosylase [Bordetella]MDM9560679.1 DNA-3-methyladenine glycosylase [Bordetella petrii]OZI76592.1 DNA-3-methyladenine glycosylase [Bordetella genomosp. 2]
MPAVDSAVAKPHYWEEAVAHLMRRDRILKKLIPQHAEAWLTSRGTPFVTLAQAIVGQQISAKAADALWLRFTETVGRRPTPAAVLEAGTAALRQAGLSQRKAEYVQDLALHFGERRVRPEKWAVMDDESVVSELLAIRGIGRWTAEMFLIFNLQRPDVLPLDDLGLLKAISLHYFSGEPVSRFEAREVSSAWQPWRTVATWYLWRSLESKPVLN